MYLLRYLTFCKSPGWVLCHHWVAVGAHTHVHAPVLLPLWRPVPGTHAVVAPCPFTSTGEHHHHPISHSFHRDHAASAWPPPVLRKRASPQKGQIETKSVSLLPHHGGSSNLGLALTLGQRVLGWSTPQEEPRPPRAIGSSQACRNAATPEEPWRYL